MGSKNLKTSQEADIDNQQALPADTHPAAAFEEEERLGLRRVQDFLHTYPTTVPIIVLALAVLFFSLIVGPIFYAPFNLSLVLQQVTIIAILGIAQTLVVLTAGIDLSVGAIMILSSVVMGRTAVTHGVPLEIAFPLGLLVGFLCGLVNGVIITLLKLPPFIVTLGTWSVFGALNILYSHMETIRQQEIAEAAPFLQSTGAVIRPFDILAGSFGITLPWLKGSAITYGTLLMVVLAVAVWYLLNRTAFGRHLHATGDDPEAARLAGVNTKRTLIAAYALAGLICAIAGWVLIGRIGSISPQAGQTANLDSITAVVIGGTSLFGGRGSIVGTLAGALIVGVFRNGLSLAGLDVLWQELTIGLLIIVAVTLDQWIRRIAG